MTRTNVNIEAFLAGLPIPVQARVYNQFLARSGMPEELPSCGDVRLDTQEILQQQLSPLNLLADLLEEHGMDPQDLYAAAKADPAGLRDFINANLPGVFGLN